MSNPRSIICYPLKPRNGSQWGEDYELLHSLRSIEQHWKGDYDDIYILGASMPEWINRDEVRFKMAPKYVAALRAACELAGPGGRILWMNDDIMLMKDTSWDDLVGPVRRERAKQMTKAQATKWTESGNGWMRRLGEIMLDLRRKGHTTWKFSTHTPYVYEADLLLPLLDQYDHLGYKVAIENAYYNIHIDKFGVTPCVDKFRTSQKRRHIPMERVGKVRFLNLTPKVSTWMKGFIRGRWPNPSRFEN
jgi:hypothetical protein